MTVLADDRLDLQYRSQIRVAHMTLKTEETIIRLIIIITNIRNHRINAYLFV